ncbi:ATP-binding cassette sub-family a member 3 [Plakobranchus ocellatus]|uniref:ATP-binding cassette sub-family a member 3 n=1 Tax=Plakobranchus ocellatus TaxID=259542 RepID=A0AAV4C9L3_9GAST|nr:ATP-binding cassette sub-family a member 3 [Plakobranchus ocellatus]
MDTYFFLSKAFNKGYVKKTGISLNLTIIRALFVKKAIHTWRNRVVALIQLLLPVLITSFSLSAITDGSVAVEPPLLLNLQPFGGSYVPFTANQVDKDFANLYKMQFGNSEILEEFQIPVVSSSKE